MLTGILNKPLNIEKGQDNFITLDRDALLADVVANKDSYFHQLSRWKQVLITYESDNGNQLNHLEFNPQTGAFPIGNFNPTITGRDVWEVQLVMIRDLDNGEVVYCREELDTAHFDITIIQAAIQSVNIQSNNTDPTIAVQGDTVTITAQAADDMFNVLATISGEAAVISGTGANRTISRVMSGTEPQGTVTFSMTYEDSGSAPYGPITSTTDLSSVNFDSVLPQMSSVTIYSNNIDTSKAETGDVITIDFTSDEPITQVLTTILGNSVSSFPQTGNDWRAQYIVQASDNGTVSFNINFEDIQGNSGAQVTSTTDSSIVTVENGYISVTTPNAFYKSSVYAGSKHVVLGGFPTTNIHSTDGFTWTSETSNSLINNSVTELIYENSQIIGILANSIDKEGPTIAKSSDGINWTTQDNPHIPSGGLVTPTLWNDIVYTGTAYIAVGTNSESQANDDNLSPTIMRSTNGTTWAVQSVPNIQSKNVGYGNGVIIVTGDGSNALGVSGILRSINDGFSWTNLAFSLNGQITYGNSLFVAMDGANIKTSNDGGLNFTTVHNIIIGGQATTMTDIQYIGNRFVACGYVVDGAGHDGVIWESVDGISWTHSIVGNEKLFTISYDVAGTVCVFGAGGASYTRVY